MQIAPYGSWKSPISASALASSSIGLGDVTVDGNDIYWLERRPTEGGRSALVMRGVEGVNRDALPSEFNVRTHAHEYGGGAYVVSDGDIVFANNADKRLYLKPKHGDARAISPANAESNFADIIIDRKHNRLICVREDHSYKGEQPISTLIALNLDGGELEMLAAGNDFYSSPCLSPDGSKLVWLSWNLPNMPWDGTTLRVAHVGKDGALADIRKVAGGATESIFQPSWSPDGVLFYTSDRTGFWNIYCHKDYTGGEIVCERAFEFGQPQWVFGMSEYAFLDKETIACGYCEKGVWRLASLNVSTGSLTDFELPYSDISYVRASAGRVAFKGASLTEEDSVLLYDPATKRVECLKDSGGGELDASFVSRAQTIEFENASKQKVFAFYYPPCSPDYQAPKETLPPLIVFSHGGPTSLSTNSFSLEIQYWTTRGFAIVDVNYGGSTGFGREYRDRLNGEWGIVDVEDCCAAAEYLISKRLADKSKCAISGGSAGGYTTLCALTFRDTFGAGASYYGISDLEALELETHKFEAKYSQKLIAPYPERKDLYFARAPINFPDRITCPVVFFQGLEDKVVPPDQSEKMYLALRDRGIPTAYVTFEGEQHGFRKASSIEKSLAGELYFYGRIFGFEPADAQGAIEIANLKT